jgi:undecaprenyl-diphosphatase
MQYDEVIFLKLYSLATQGKLFYIIVFTAKYLPYLLVAGAILAFFFLPARDWKARTYFAATAILAAILARGIITETIRFFYGRLRPYEALSDIKPLFYGSSSAGSFPSGHMTFLFSVAAALFFYNKKWGGWFMAASALVGVARIISGLHWPSDIFAGALIGIISAALVKLLLAPIVEAKGDALGGKSKVS